MVFNSFEFIVFLSAGLFLYWTFFSGSAKAQNWLLLAASLFFYGWWDPILLLCGKNLFHIKTERKRSALLYLHVVISGATLCFFKYFNFFADQFHVTGSSPANSNVIKILFPLGLSFYTFKNLSYVLDLYKGRSETVATLPDYLVYTTFFPSIVSGPIDKSAPFLQQISEKRKLNSEAAFSNINLIALGFFKKIMIADSVAGFVDRIFTQPAQYSTATVIGGVFLYAFQIYTDFSGYSDIAKGVAGLFGINIMANFNFPFFSKNITEFWRRWHISLSTWLNDYLFNPLAITFRNLGLNGVYLAILVTFIVSGIWHGEGLPYLVWGLLHAIYYIPMVYFGSSFSGITTGKSGTNSLNFRNLPAVLITFIEVSFALIFFRAASLSQAFLILQRFVGLGAAGVKLPINLQQLYKGLISIALLFIYELAVFQNEKYRFTNFANVIKNDTAKFCFRVFVYCCLFWVLILWGGEGNKSFIYVKF